MPLLGTLGSWRLIATARRPPAGFVAEGKLQPDLVARLATLTIELPPPSRADRGSAAVGPDVSGRNQRHGRQATGRLHARALDQWPSILGPAISTSWPKWSSRRTSGQPNRKSVPAICPARFFWRPTRPTGRRASRADRSGKTAGENRNRIDRAGSGPGQGEIKAGPLICWGSPGQGSIAGWSRSAWKKTTARAIRMKFRPAAKRIHQPD